MTSYSAAMNWAQIYRTLIKEFPKDDYLWDEDDLHNIVTALTVALITDAESK